MDSSPRDRHIPEALEAMGMVTSDPARYRPARGELLWVCRAFAVVCRYYFGVVGDLSRYFVVDLRPFVTDGD